MAHFRDVMTIQSNGTSLTLVYLKSLPLKQVATEFEPSNKYHPYNAQTIDVSELLKTLEMRRTGPDGACICDSKPLAVAGPDVREILIYFMQIPLGHFTTWQWGLQGGHYLRLSLQNISLVFQSQPWVPGKIVSSSSSIKFPRLKVFMLFLKCNT